MAQSDEARGYRDGLLRAAEIVHDLWRQEVENRPMVNIHRRDLDHAYTRAEREIREAAARLEGCDGTP